MTILSDGISKEFKLSDICLRYDDSGRKRVDLDPGERSITSVKAGDKRNKFLNG